MIIDITAENIRSEVLEDELPWIIAFTGEGDEIKGLGKTALSLAGMTKVGRVKCLDSPKLCKTHPSLGAYGYGIDAKESPETFDGTDDGEIH